MGPIVIAIVGGICSGIAGYGAKKLCEHLGNRAATVKDQEIIHSIFKKYGFNKCKEGFDKEEALRKVFKENELRFPRAEGAVEGWLEDMSPA